jgi:hypothetical protein
MANIPAERLRQPASNYLTDLAFRIRAEHDAAAFAVQRGVHHAMTAGDLLIEAKRMLAHGQWLPWLKQYCGIPARTASLYMRLARRLETLNRQYIADLTIQSALRLLQEVDDLRETKDQLVKEFWRRHAEVDAHHRTLSPPVTTEQAEKCQSDFQTLFFYNWLIAETFFRLGVHTALGMTEHEWLDHIFSQLQLLDGDEYGIAPLMLNGLKAWHDEPFDYDEMAELALREAAE